MASPHRFLVIAVGLVAAALCGCDARTNSSGGSGSAASAAAAAASRQQLDPH